MPTDLKWLLGARLDDAARQDFTWWFLFSGGGTITTDAFWRLVTLSGITASASDEGHTFGLGVPFDSITKALDATKEKTITGVRIAERTSDLSLTFEGGVQLDFLNLSSGFESWHAKHDSEEIICMGGGQLSLHSNENGG